MIIRQLDIENFRGIKSLSLQLGETTVIFGSNNTGKSTIIPALAKFAVDPLFCEPLS